MYIDSNTTYIYPNLYERGELTTGSQDYTLEFVSNESTTTITDTQTPSAKTTRYFQFEVPTITNDGYYDFVVKKEGVEIYRELCFVSKSSSRYSGNTITNTWTINKI